MSSQHIFILYAIGIFASLLSFLVYTDNHLSCEAMTVDIVDRCYDDAVSRRNLGDSSLVDCIERGEKVMVQCQKAE